MHFIRPPSSKWVPGTNWGCIARMKESGHTISQFRGSGWHPSSKVLPDFSKNYLNRIYVLEHVQNVQNVQNCKTEHEP